MFYIYKNEEDIATNDVWDSRRNLKDAISVAERAAKETFQSDMYIADDFEIVVHVVKFSK